MGLAFFDDNVSADAVLNVPGSKQNQYQTPNEDNNFGSCNNPFHATEWYCYRE